MGIKTIPATRPKRAKQKIYRSKTENHQVGSIQSIIRRESHQKIGTKILIATRLKRAKWKIYRSKTAQNLEKIFLL